MAACAVCGKRVGRRDLIRPHPLDPQTLARAHDGFCFRALNYGNKTMIDPTEQEKAAVEHAGQMAGEYLDSIRKTDLAKLSHEEWDTFCRVMCGAFIEKVSETSKIWEALASIVERDTSQAPF